MSDNKKRTIVTMVFMTIVILFGWYVTQDVLWFYSTENGRIGFVIFLVADLVLITLMGTE